MNWVAYAGIHWPRNSRKWVVDLSNTGTRTMGFVHLDNVILPKCGLENGNKTPPSGRCGEGGCVKSFKLRKGQIVFHVFLLIF